MIILLPIVTIGQNYRLDSITGSNGLLEFSIYDNYGNSIEDYYNFSTINWKYENNYDLNNNKTESILFENNLGLWQEYMRFNFTYDINNKLIISYQDNWGSGGSWQPSTKNTYSYTNNYLTLSEYYTWTNGQWDTTQKSEYNYTNGNQTQVLYSNWVNGTWVPIQKNERVFLNNNISTETYFSYTVATGWSISFSADFYCNNNLINNTIYGISMADLSQFSNQVTEMVYSFGDTYNYHYSNYNIPTNIESISITKDRLFKIVDILGKNTKAFKNKPLFYIYEDGTVEKRIVIE